MAVNGPDAATMINFLVAEDYKKFAPRQILSENKSKGKKKVKSEDE